VKAITRFHATLLGRYVVSVNWVGTEGKGVLWGGSHVLDPCGRTVAAAPLYTGELVMAAVDLAGVACRRRETPLLENPRLDFLLQELSRLTTNREEAGVQRPPPRARAPEYR
jgi:predicted amidohydrolase